MRAWLASDIHLEGNNYKFDLPDADVAILAGDIFTPWRLTSSNAEKFFRRVHEKYGTIVYVPGNHEHYHGQFPETDLLLENLFHNWGVKVHNLNNDVSVIINDVLFVGGTLWTDYDRGNPLHIAIARQAMSDFHLSFDGRDPTGLLRPETVYKEHQRRLVQIEETLNTHHTKQAVIVTHHLPLMQCVHPRYENSPLNFSFASDLSHFMLQNCFANVTHWFYGHTHEPGAFEFEAIEFRTNPHGYGGEFQHEKFDPALVVEI